jgi:hypothetical protein
MPRNTGQLPAQNLEIEMRKAQGRFLSHPENILCQEPSRINSLPALLRCTDAKAHGAFCRPPRNSGKLALVGVFGVDQRHLREFEVKSKNRRLTPPVYPGNREERVPLPDLRIG